MPSIQLFCGTGRSARSRHVDAIVRAHWGRSWLIVPTRQYAQRRTEQLLLEGDLPGAWGRPVLAFDDFVVSLLAAEGVEPKRVGEAERRFLFERVVVGLRRKGRLGSLGPVTATAGFISHLMRTVAQLKQAAIEPNAFRTRLARRATQSPVDDAVAEVYEAYQAALHGRGLYDVPGLFWQADLIAQQGRPEVLAGADTLCLDGFDDFTPSEFRLVCSLARHVERMAFGLNYDPDPNRRDLFEIAARTAHAIQRHFDVEPLVLEEPPAETFVEFAAGNVFWRNRPKAVDGLERNIEIAACTDPVQEIEAVGRRVKRLLVVDGVPASEIAVVFRDLGAAAGILEHVFAEFGVPIHIIHSPNVLSSALAGFVLDVLDAAGSWSRDAVVSILTRSWFRFGAGPSRAHAAKYSRLARVAQVISGRDEWRSRVEALRDRLAKGSGEDIEGLVARMPDAVEAVEALLEDIQRLDRLLAWVPEAATPGAFAVAIERLVTDAQLASAVQTHAVAEVRRNEEAALRAVRALLAAMAAWEDPNAEHEPRAQFAERLRRAYADTPFARPREVGGVACLDALAIRHLRFDHVFFCGVNEGEVPRPPVTNALYSEDDLDELRRIGIDIEGKRLHSAREALLFHHVLSGARKRLCVTWHTLSSQGQPKLASPYIDDLVELFPGSPIHSDAPRPGAFVPHTEEVASWRDAANAACGGSAPALRAALGESLAAIEAGAAIETARHGVRPFDEYDGVLADAALRAELSQRFGVDHVFSVGQIETYLDCPFRFLVARVLGLDETETPSEELDPRLRGAILHGVLESFHRHFLGIPAAAIPENEARECLSALLERQFGPMSRRNRDAGPGVLAVECAAMAVQLERYLNIERDAQDFTWKPAHFEVSFGRTHSSSTDPLNRNEPFELTMDGEAVRFAGRIDRVDCAGNRARIIDYKTSAVPKTADIREGRAVQLIVYAWALEGLLLPEAVCAEAAYVAVGRERGKDELRREGNKPEWPEREAMARASITRAVAGIRAGRFPPTPHKTSESCGYCAARRICRHEAGRIERKEGVTGE